MNERRNAVGAEVYRRLSASRRTGVRADGRLGTSRPATAPTSLESQQQKRILDQIVSSINLQAFVRGANLANACQAEARGTSDTAKHVPVASSARGLPATLCVSSILHLLY